MPLFLLGFFVQLKPKPAGAADWARLLWPWDSLLLSICMSVRGESQTEPLAGLCKGRPSCLRSGLLLDRYWVQCTLLLLRIKPVALSRTPLNPSLACGQKQCQALSELLHDYFSLCSLTRVCTGFLNFQHHDNTCKYLFYSLLVIFG